MAETKNTLAEMVEAIKKARNGSPATMGDVAVFLIAGTVGLFADVALHSAFLPSMGVCSASSATGAVGVKLAFEARLAKNAGIRAAKRLAKELDAVSQGNYTAEAQRLVIELRTEAGLIKSGNGDIVRLNSLRTKGADLIRKSRLPPLLSATMVTQDNAVKSG